MNLSGFSSVKLRTLLAAVLAASLFPAAAQTQSNPPAAQPRKPCVILVLAEDLGAAELGCYGQTRIKTPNIDKLATEGLRFTSFYAGNSLSSASRVTLMTGKDPGHVPIRGAKIVSLTGDDFILPELLKKAGYATAASGKWGLGYAGSAGVPGRKGFDEWFGFLDEQSAQDYYPQYADRTHEGENHPNQMVPLNSYGKKGKYINDFFTESALNFMQFSQPEEINRFRPFFQYLPYTIPRVDVEYGPAPVHSQEIPGVDPYTEEPWPESAKIRAAMITRLDWYVGQLLDKLAAEKIDRNTIFIVTSATGPQKRADLDPNFFKSAGALRGFKRDLYEGAIRVPFIVRWPVQIRPGTTSDLPAALWDVLPTLADAAHAPIPEDVDGISLLPTFKGQTQTNRHEFLYWELHDRTFKQAVRMGDWKAVRLSATGPLELYNLKTDPGEKSDVADKNPQVIAKIEQYLKTARTDDPRWPAHDDPAGTPPGGG